MRGGGAGGSGNLGVRGGGKVGKERAGSRILVEMGIFFCNIA